MKQNYLLLLTMMLCISFINAQDNFSTPQENISLNYSAADDLAVYSDVDFEIASFDEKSLEDESYWNGSDGTGGFISGAGWFFNDYNSDWASWSGWAISNISDNTTPGWGNQYSAITGSGRSTSDDPSYAISYASPSSGLIFKDSSTHLVEGCYITNSTYTALSMIYGDAYSKKFGGVDGNDPDWLTLDIEGYVDGNVTETVTFYLADFTSEKNEEDYIVQTWKWVDLTSLGKVDSLSFSMASSDVGQWGMNTPAYFSMDDLMVHPDAKPLVQLPLTDISEETGKQLEIDISGLFTDPDDDDNNIETVLKSNSDPSIALAEIQQDKLLIDIRDKGETTIVIEGISNNKAVLDTMVVSARLASNHADMFELVSVYPNPANGMFKFKTGKLLNVSVAVFDIRGRLILKKEDYNNEQIIDLSGSPDGTYIIMVQSEGSIYRSKLIIK